jgi:hypothetical protein
MLLTAPDCSHFGKVSDASQEAGKNLAMNLSGRGGLIEKLPWKIEV